MERRKRNAKASMLTPEQQKSRRQRNIAIGLAVGFFVLFFYVVTIAKLGPGVLRSADVS